MVQVTENLEAALRQFQKRHLNSGEQTYPFWIDALCVNQTDNKDRTVQVQRMGKIFSSAEKVFIWLGEEADNSQLAIQKLGHLGEKALSCGISKIDVDNWPDIGSNPDDEMIDRMIALEQLQEETVISYDSNADVPLLPIRETVSARFLGASLGGARDRTCQDAHRCLWRRPS